MGNKEKIDILKFMDNIRTARADGDDKAVEMIRKRHGDLEATYDDLERVTEFIMSNLGYLLMGQQTRSQSQFETTIKMLVEEETLSDNGAELLLELDREIEDKINNPEEENDNE